MFKRIFIVFIFTSLILGGLFGFKFYQTQKAISQIKPVPPAVVAAAKVKQEQWITSLTAVGSLNPVGGVEVSNEVVGKIKAIHFESGQSVKTNQLLVELDTETDLAELAGLQAELQLAQTRLQRSEKMVQKKYLSQAEYDQNIAQLEQARAAVQAQRTRIDKKSIRAPFAGDLGIRQVDIGQYLSEGTAIVSLQKLTPIFVDFALPERHISQIAIQQQIHITTQAYPGKSFTGKIKAISPALDSDTRSLKVRAQIENPAKLLRPGMFAQVQIQSGNSVTVLTLPDTAISYNPYGNAVFLIETTDKGLIVKNRQVVTGQSREGRVEIISGLNAGDQVVSAGQVKLRNGMSVNIDSQPAPGERETAK
jgi:membrane fusion protein (multidrug efflux system)